MTLAEMMRENSIEGNARYVKDAVSNKARTYLLILTYVKGPVSFKNLSNHFKSKQAVINYHLRKLEKAELVKKGSPDRTYSITRTGEEVLELFKCKEFLDEKI